MTKNHENRFIPSHAMLYAIYAVIGPYLVILIRNLGYTPLSIGILMGIFEGAGLTGPFLFGYWADRTGNYRYALIVSVLIPAFVIFPMVTWVHPVITAVLLALMSFGLRSGAALLDSVTTIQIGESGDYGRIRVWGSISFIAVSLYFQWTPFLKLNSASNISIWIVIISAFTVIPICLLRGAALRSSAEFKTVKNTGEKMIPIFSVYVLGGFGIIFLSRFSMAAIFSYFPLYMTEVLHWNAVSMMYAVAAVSEIPFFFLSRLLIRRFGPFPLLALSCAGICLRLLILAFLPFKPFIIFSQLLHSLCFGIFHPAAVYFIASIFPARIRGKGMAVFFALSCGLPILIGNIIGGAIVEAAGYRPLFVIYAAVAGAAVSVYFMVSRLNLRKYLPTHRR